MEAKNAWAEFSFQTRLGQLKSEAALWNWDSVISCRDLGSFLIRKKQQNGPAYCCWSDESFWALKKLSHPQNVWISSWSFTQCSCSNETGTGSMNYILQAKKTRWISTTQNRYLFAHNFIKNYLKLFIIVGSGCGSVVERLLPTPEILSSNPIIGKNLYWMFTDNCIEKTKIKKNSCREWPN